MKEIAKLPRVPHTCTYDAVMTLAEEYRAVLIHAVKNMSSTEIYKLHDSWLRMREQDHFTLLNESVNLHKRRKGDI